MQRAVPGRPRRRSQHRITGSDSGFLYIETDTQTSTCTHAVVLAPPAAGQTPLTRESLRDHLAARLPRTPVLGRVLQHVPRGVGHALLVDHDVDLDTLVHHAVLPAPEGGSSSDDAYHAWLADQVGLRLDLSRSLWQVTLVDGFGDGRQALVFAVHHTLGDGAALLALLAELLDDRAERRPSPATARELAPHPRRHPAVLFATTLASQAVVWLTLPLLLVRTIGRFRRTRLARETSSVPVPPAAGGAPACVLNTSADTHRAFARTSVSLEDLRRVRGAAGTTLSDVVLAVVAGALREDLAARDALPEEPLVVNVPLGHDAPGAAPRLSGNVFCNYYAMLPTDVADPRERLAAMAAYSAEARRQLDIQGRDTLITWLDRIPPFLGERGARMMAEKHRTGEAGPDFNVLVSNLRVPEDSWTMQGRVVEEVSFSGPVADGAGLNITVVGFGDRVTFAVQSNPSALPDPAGLARGLHTSLRALLAASALEDGGVPRAATEGQVA